MTEILRETSSTLQSAGASKWKAVLITPGKGSSGSYAEDMLREYGPSAFPKGTHSYVDHPRDGESRNPKNLFGVLAEGAHYEEGVGLVATLEVMPHWSAFAAAVAPYTGLSIYAAAEREMGGDGYVVEKILPAIDNSIDLVSYAGRGGQMAEQLYESAINSPLSTSIKEGELVLTASMLDTISKQTLKRVQEALAEETSATSAENGLSSESVRSTTKENQVEIEALGEKVDALQKVVEALAAVVTPLAEQATTAAEDTVENPPVEIDFARVAEACVKAGLPEAARKVVYDQVRLGGIDPDAAIAEQKALVESIEAQVAESLGSHRLRVGTDSPNQDFTLHINKWAVN